MTDTKKPETGALAQWRELERRESSLWRTSLLLLILLAFTIAFTVTQPAGTRPGHFKALSFGLVILVALFGAYAWIQKRKIAQLRGFLQGYAEGHAGPPSDEQLEKLFEIVARSQHSFRELIDSFDRIAFNISLDGQIRVINREFADILGLPFAEIVNHPLEDFVAEPTRAQIEPFLPRFIEKRSWNGVAKVRWKPTGQIRFYECTLYAVVKDGKVTGASGLARDVSSQRETESRFTDLFETLHEGIYFSAPDGTLLDVNPALVQMLGYASKAELLEKNLGDHFADLSQRIPLFSELRDAGSLRDREIVLRRKDGSSVLALNSCVAIRDASGQFVRFQGSLVDITERRAIEARLREEQEFVRRLVASFPDIIVVLDKDGRYTFVSPRVEEFLGYTPEEYIGMGLDDRPHPDDRDSVMEFFTSLITGKMSFGTVEYRTAHKDGGWRTFRANAGPLTDADGKIIGIVASARDVTESKRLEQQLLQSEKLAAIGQMVSGVAHELNNPLTAILGMSDLVRERATDDASRRQIELVQKQARKAVELVQDLLNFSRPSRPKSQHVRLAELINRAIELQQFVLASRNIAVDFDATLERPEIEADPNQMVQVFVNLLANAEQFIATARDRGRIGIHIAESEGKAEILIDDDGPGVPPEIRAKIFDPFFTTRRSSGGTGLGLTICLVIIKEHGGTIEVQSSPAGGARFRILLPISRSAAPSPSSFISQREGIKGRSILVVEDEDSIRELVEEGLKARGAAVEAVRTGEEAWKKISAHLYDVVVCDFNLGGVSGLELFDRVRSRIGVKHPQFLFITGEIVDPSQVAALQEKGSFVLQKPFQIADLVSTIEKFIARRTSSPK
ncbi:MAG TPA: PAS domain S-box protein [Candidatus Acidoferrales bacterium]|nr:PAS domain S-box protein [Candidatus Acidoferrales bacterium]